VRLATRLLLRPLPGIAPGFRLTIRPLGRAGPGRTDLVNPRGLPAADVKSMQLVENRSGRRAASIQFYGAEADELPRRPVGPGPWSLHYDINMGCPVDRCQEGGGSALLRNPANAVRLASGGPGG